MILSDTDKLEWITKEDTTIFVFLPPPDTDRAKSPESAVDQFATGKQPGNDNAWGTKKMTPPTTQQKLQESTQLPSQNGEPTQKSGGKTSNHLVTPLSATKYLCEFRTPGAREEGSLPICRQCLHPHP